MGLLDYIKANTPRNTRPRVSPATVINQGLLNPNQYNKPQADRFKDSMFGLLGIVPGVGDAASAAESADLFNRGENFAGSLAALGALPLVPAIGGMFVGKGAKTFDFLKAKEAEEMLAKGVDPREVWKQTGTMRGVDGAMRQEIPDNAASFVSKTFPKTKFSSSGNIHAGAQDVTVKDAVRHGKLFEAYPDAVDIGYRGSYEWGANPWGSTDSVTGKVGQAGGSYEPGYDRIRVGTGYAEDMAGAKKQTMSSTLHELQHAIQQREGWAKGGSPSDFMPEQTVNDARIIAARIAKGETPSQAAKWLKEKLGRTADVQVMDLAMQDPVKLFSYPSNPDLGYRRLAGEAEARLTQARAGMNMDERLMSYPYDMLDVPIDQLIVRGLLK